MAVIDRNNTMIEKNVAIIIPVYNEEQVIGGVVKTMLTRFKYVICVDDGSTDNSSIEIKRTAAYLISHPINMGQGATLQTGIEFARQIPEVEYLLRMTQMVSTDLMMF